MENCRVSHFIFIRYIISCMFFSFLWKPYVDRRYNIASSTYGFYWWQGKVSQLLRVSFLFLDIFKFTNVTWANLTPQFRTDIYKNCIQIVLSGYYIMLLPKTKKYKILRPDFMTFSTCPVVWNWKKNYEKRKSSL